MILHFFHKKEVFFDILISCVPKISSFLRAIARNNKHLQPNLEVVYIHLVYTTIHILSEIV